MTATIDGAGRVVIPKALRERAGLAPGTRIDFNFHDGAIEIRPLHPVADEVEWEDHGGILYPVITAEGTSMTGDELNDLIHRMREERTQQVTDAAG